MIMEERMLSQEGEELAPGNFLEKPTMFVSVKAVIEGFSPKTENGPAAYFNQVLIVLMKMVERVPKQAD